MNDKKKLRDRRRRSSNARQWRWRSAILGSVIVAGIGLAAAVRVFDSYKSTAVVPPITQAIPPAHYVGSTACVSCHEDKSAAWQASQHHDAMAEATSRTVLGNFRNSTFTYAGTTSRFFERDGGFYVRTDGRDGAPADFSVKYTFGVYPLQQYLVEFPDGRLQALSIAWDARPKDEGGQRWFHLYPDERIKHDDELHWTRPAQNWNFMCADCHSTGVRKNYDAGADRFATGWQAINVSCEACHGPASRHLEWAASNTRSARAADDATKGLTATLDERHGVTWSVDVKSGNAARSRPRTTDREIEVCAPCHSRRAQIAEGYEAGTPLLDHYFPALLTSPLYYPDGQQRGEVYNWGSFLQSKMYANGVTCSDCHEPHSGKPRLEGNALCSTCHLSSKYDDTSHHRHAPASAGASCVACHMPASTYMVVDRRHDHSLRIPRPDLSVTLGTPNACTGCHTGRDASWAAARVKDWYGHDPQGHQRFAAAFSDANVNGVDRQAQLRAVAGDATHPAIARATALSQLDTSSDRAAIETVARSLRDSNGIVRFGALQSMTGAPPAVRVPLAAALLSDPLKAVRVEAVSVLAPVPADQLPAAMRGAFDLAAREYVEVQRYNADRAEGRVNLGTFYGNRGDTANGERELKVAIRLDPFYVPSYVNLADLYRALDRDPEGERTLRQGLTVAPANAALHYALGLALVRLKRAADALGELERASALDPGNARFIYTYAVALHSAGKTDAAKATLEKALAAHPGDANVRAALASFTDDGRSQPH